MNSNKILLVDTDNYLSRIYNLHKRIECNENTSEQDELEIIFNVSLKVLTYFDNLLKYNHFKDIIFIYDTKTWKDNNKKDFLNFIEKYNINSEWYKGQRSKRANFNKFKQYYQNILFFKWYTLMWSDKFEADDVMATKAVEYEKQGYIVQILSNDNDMKQILTENIQIVKWIWRKDLNNSYSKLDFMFDFNLKYQVDVIPMDIIYIKCVLWDKSDNIKGIKWIGPKTLYWEMKNFWNILKTNIYKNNKDFIDDLSKIIKLNTNINNEDININKDWKNDWKYRSYLKNILNELKNRN